MKEKDMPKSLTFKLNRLHVLVLELLLINLTVIMSMTKYYISVRSYRFAGQSFNFLFDNTNSLLIYSFQGWIYIYIFFFINF